MKNVLAGLTTFAAVLLIAALVRAAVLSQDGATPVKNEPAKTQNTPAPEKGHEGHTDMGKKEEPKKEEPKKDDGKKPDEKPAEVQDLANESDPVTGAKLGESKVILEHKGWKIAFAADTSKQKFQKNPIRYYTKLSLEPTTDGKLLKVDASKYEKALADTCPIMGGDIDPDGEVYILHRGFKVYFCCWSGCADEFMEKPSTHYAHYGLVEKDGKLVRK